MKNSTPKPLYGNSDLSKYVALKVAGWRIAAGLTQMELAKRAKMKTSAIGRIEGGWHLPTLRTLNKIVVALGKELTFKLK